MTDAVYCTHCGTAVPPGTVYCPACGSKQESVQPAPYAGFWLRFWAYMLDGLILSVPSFLFLAFVFAGLARRLTDLRFPPHENPGELPPEFPLLLGWIFIFTVVSWVGTWLYEALFLSSRYQATPGKMALSIVVTDRLGNRLTFGRASLRYLGKVLSGMTFSIGFLMAAFTEKKQALHDLLVGTLVVKK